MKLTDVQGSPQHIRVRHAIAPAKILKIYPKHFIWKAKTDDILENVKRARKALYNHHSA